MAERAKIPFNRPFIVGKELFYISKAVLHGHLAGDGYYSKQCHAWLEEKLGVHMALLTHSCTAALEIAALLSEVGPGDEVLMPSFTFVSTANAFVLRGARPKFIDIREDTKNMDETLFEKSVGQNCKAVVPMHYGGVACEMDTIMDVAERHDLLVIEDAAQGLGSTYKGKPLGSIGHFGTLSFHETKNIVSGEGGALLVNSPKHAKRAEILREKGTNRSAFFRGEIDKYTWVDIGSSYLPSELVSAFLFAQLEEADTINSTRMAIYRGYEKGLADLEAAGKFETPIVPAHCKHNAHLYYCMLESEKRRDDFIKFMKDRGVMCVFHYVPLHASPMGRKFGYKLGDFPVTESISKRLVRLPSYFELKEEDQQRVIDCIHEYFA